MLAKTLDDIEVPNTIINAAAMTAIVSNSLLSDIARFPFTYLLSGRTKTSITMHSEIAYSESYYFKVRKNLDAPRRRVVISCLTGRKSTPTTTSFVLKKLSYLKNSLLF